MKDNFLICCIYLICTKKFVSSHFMTMRWVFVILCCIMIIPATAYAQSDTDMLQIGQEQYIVKRTGEVVAKVFGNVDDVYAKVTLTHTSPDGESTNHTIRITDQGYYEFYFVHDWESIRGKYDVSVIKNETSVGIVSYELVQDPEYKTDAQVKEEYLMKREISISADAVQGSKTINITGHISSASSTISLMVIAPNRNVISIDQIIPNSDGSFTSTINIGGPMWKQDGMYSISAQHGSDSMNKSTVEVEISDGVVIPEFGTIASLVLVVAISSIVMLSAKSKLRFQAI